MGNNYENKGMIGFTRATCSVLFCAFCLLYLLCWQADLLAVAQHYYSGGQTSYAPVPGAIIVTAVLLGLQVVVARLSSRGLGRIPALTFLPSAFILTALTAVREVGGGTLTFGHWPVVLPLLLVGFFLLALLGGSWLSAVAQRWQQRGGVAEVLGNLVVLLAALLFVCVGCNSDRLYHARIHAEQCLNTGRVDEALATLEANSEADSCLTLLTANALARKGELGERLFRFPLMGGSDALLPNGSSVRLAILPEASLYETLARVRVVNRTTPKRCLSHLIADSVARPAALDYLLCVHLLDRDLDAFVAELSSHRTINDSLPTHYKEALTLYTHLRSNPKVIFSSAVMDADYEDYQHFGSDIKDSRARRNALRDTYGSTYWFYYEQCNK